MDWRDIRNKLIRTILGRYMSDEIVDRILETTATFILGAGGLIALGTLAPVGLTGSAVVGFILIAASAFIVARRGMFSKFSERLRKDRLLYRIAGFLNDTTEEIRLLKKKVALAFILTMIFKALDVMVWVFSYSCLGTGNEIPISLAAVTMCLGGLVATIPVTPILTGVPYLAQSVLIVGVSGIAVEVARDAPLTVGS